MGHDHQRDVVLAVQLEQQTLHAFAGRGIEVAGRLVGEHRARLLHDRACDRDALLLAARELARPVGETLRRADPLEQLRRAAARALGRRAGDQRGHHHVLERR